MSKEFTNQLPVIDSSVMSRRTFLRLAAVMGGMAIGETAIPAANLYRSITGLDDDPIFKVRLDNDPKLNFRETSALAVRFDKCFDQLPIPEVPQTEEEMIEMALELIPQFQYEGITPRSEWPQDVKFVIFGVGDTANHVLGRSDCETFAIVNGRTALKFSSWNSQEIPFTLAHELAHVAQTDNVCRGYPSKEVESSAQIGALEVTSGLALQGNPLWLWATISELRGMAMSASYGLALKDNDFEKYHRLRNKLSPGAVSEARFQKSKRRWADDPTRLRDILENYNIYPLDRIVTAIKYDKSEISDLAFPPVYDNPSYWYPGMQKSPIKLDDLTYLIGNMESLVEDTLRKYERKSD